ncbi:nucleolar preribosomal assembly protein, putative [Plasmodium malariae]|uniref:Ribosome production factor 2 homolog n=1 Tax=Plasmodium malariae TaxID=5858 RepID=A0A1A8VS77_PLAMA|nr:nucleolar preribosomal assembly protein, putative [Plasmodium malariae]
MYDESKEDIIDRIRGEKAKTRKGKVILKKREGEFHEGSKNCLFISSNKRTELLKNFMQDIYILRKPLTCYMPKLHQNLSNLLDKIDSLVDICIYNSCSFFFCIFSTKKNPSRFILGRLYNKNILDYYVFSLVSFIPFHIFPLSKEIISDTKPIVLIQGSYFDQTDVTKYLKNILFDFFKHRNVDSFTRNSIQRLIVLTAYERIVSIDNNCVNGTSNTSRGDSGENANKLGSDNLSSSVGIKGALTDNVGINNVGGKSNRSYRDVDGKNKYVISFRQYLLRKGVLSQTDKDIPELEEIGPRFEFTLENYKIPDYHLFQEAIKKADIPKKNKIKKVKVDEFGNSIKRVYVQKQNFTKLHTKHTKILKKTNKVNSKKGKHE